MIKPLSKPPNSPTKKTEKHRQRQWQPGCGTKAHSHGNQCQKRSYGKINPTRDDNQGHSQSH